MLLIFGEFVRAGRTPPPAIANRIRRLDEAGVITGHRAQLDMAK